MTKTKTKVSIVTPMSVTQITVQVYANVSTEIIAGLQLSECSQSNFTLM